jgi:GNAT superfamily N-acetyltransferase
LAEFLVRRALAQDVPQIEALLFEWLTWKPKRGRSRSIRRAIRNNEFLVAERRSRIVGFAHFVMHEDVVDGAPNAFVTALYVRERFRGRGVGTGLLREVILASAARGAVFIETSTLHSSARAFYEKNHFTQTMGDIGEVFLELDVAEFLKAQ